MAWVLFANPASLACLEACEPAAGMAQTIFARISQMDRVASCPARQIFQLGQQLTRTGRPRSGWVQRVKAKQICALLCKCLNLLGKQRPKIIRKRIHLGNSGFVGAFALPLPPGPRVEYCRR